MTSELFLVSLLVLLLVLVVLLVLCWMLRNNKNRNLTELQISAGQTTHVLTIRTNPDHAQQLLDHVLDRVFLQVEPEAESRKGDGEEPARTEDLGGEGGSEFSTAASRPSRAVDTLQKKLWKWFSLTIPPAATPPPSGPSTHQDHINEASQQTSQGAHCSASWEDKEHDESHL